MNSLLNSLIFVGAAILEVGGDALIRKGMRQNGFLLILLGVTVLGCYGVIVNTVRWDFSKLLGVYVAVFAAVSIAFGRLVFKEVIPTSTWLGLFFILLGGLIIQFSQK